MAARHDLEGQCGLRYEDIFWGEIPARISCKCGKRGCIAELTFNWGPSGGRAAEQSCGVTYYTGPDGKIFVPVDEQSAVPAGYVKRRTTTFAETQHLEKRLNESERRMSSKVRERIHQGIEFQEALERSERANLSPERLQALAREERREREQREYEAHGQVRTYKPAIEDDNARARLAEVIAKRALAEANRQKSDYTAVDPGIHFRQLHYEERRR